MKTNMQFLNRIPKLIPISALAAITLAGNVQATVWTFTNQSSTAWTTATNWSPNSAAGLGTIPALGATNYPGRVNVASAAAGRSNCRVIYDSPLTTGLGTYDLNSPEFGRAMSIANGSGTTGAVEVVSGTLVAFQAVTADAVIVGAAGNNTGTSKGYLTLNGGNLTIVATNYGVISIPFRGGPNSLGMVTVANGSTLKSDRIRFGGTGAGADIGAGLPGILNLQSGGTVNVRNIGNYSNPNNLRATNNLDGGTIKVLAAESLGEGRNPLIGSNIANQVLAGGLIVDTAGFDARIVSPLMNGTGGLDGGVTKNGTGWLNLRGVGSTYTGPTIVNAGTLGVQVPMASTDLRVVSGATLNLITDNAAPWTLPSLALTNVNLGFDYGNYQGYSGAVADVAALRLVGTVRVNLVGTTFPATSLTLLTYGSKTGGGSFALGTLPTGAVATLEDTGSALILHLTSASLQALFWTASVNGNWQTTGAANWNFGAATYLEYPSGVGDIVTFDDYGFGPVNIPAVVRPTSVTVSGAFSSYVFSGTGGIQGPTGLSKEGTGTLQVSTGNDYTGATVIAGGTLFADHPKALGATSSGTTVVGPASTLALGIPGGNGVTVTGETVTINGPGVGGARGALRGMATASGSNVWAGPVIIGDATARIGTEDGGNLTVAGNITDGGFNSPLLLRPGANATLVVSGTGNAWVGSTTLFGSDNTSLVLLGAHHAFPTNSLLLVGNGTVLDLNGFNQTSAGLALATGGTASALLRNTGAAVTLTLNPAANQSFPGDISGSLSLVKAGTNVQTLTGLDLSYTGATLVSAGQLNLVAAGAMATAVTVASGASLGGEATTSGALTLEANSGLSVDPVTPGSFAAATINASSSPIRVSFAGLVPTEAPVVVLSTAGGITGSAANFVAPEVSGGVFYLTNGNTQLMFAASATPTVLTWKGNDATNPTLWNTVSTNWLNAGQADRFLSGDNVIFDDTAATFAVTAQTPSVAPASVVFSNASQAYTLTGGAIAGSATVAKLGAGLATLGGANSYTGETLIQAGTLRVDNGAALGSVTGGTTVTNGGTLDENGLNLGAEVITISGVGVGGQGAVVNNSGVDQISALQKLVLASNATIGGNSRWDFRGTGNSLDLAGFTLTKTGTNYCALVATTVSNPGHIVVAAGTFGLHLGTDLGGWTNNTLTVQSGAKYNNYAASAPAYWTLILNDGGSFWAENGGAFQNVWAGPVVFNGRATLQADATLEISGEIIGAGSLTKTGNSTATLSAVNKYTGDTTIGAGRLVLNIADCIKTSPVITVSSNATLDAAAFGLSLGAAQTLQGAGTVLGDVMANGTLIPGSAIGTLKFGSSLTIAGNLRFELDKSLAQSNDVINVTGTLNNTGAGTLTVSNLGPGLVVGDKFILFNQAVPNGNALTIVGPAGVTFANHLAVDGSITVLTAPPAAPTLSYSFSGSGFQFTWTGSGKLQAQTNSLSVGLSNNWADYPGGGSSPVSVPVDATKGAVFFRLVAP